MKNVLRWLAVLVPAMLLAPGAALADSMADYTGSSTTSAYGLLPVEFRALSAQPDAGNLDSVADQINLSVGSADDGVESITDVVQVPLLDEILDENGELNLPLGIRVYDTMGDPSVGFGSNF